MELDGLESAFDLQELLAAKNEETSSISRGVFAFKGATKKRSYEEANDSKSKCKRGKASKIVKSPRKKVKENDDFERNQEEVDDFKQFCVASGHTKSDMKVRQRYMNYKKELAEAIGVMHHLQSENYSQIVDQVVKFVQKVDISSQKHYYNSEKPGNGNDDPLFEESLSLFRQSIKSSEIPTAALLTGVNVPDHSYFFNILSTQLRKKLSSPHVASIQAKECGTNLRHLMRAVISQLIGMQKSSKGNCGSLDDGSDTDNDEENEEKAPKSRFNKHCSSLASLKTWYDNQYPNIVKYDSECNGNKNKSEAIKEKVGQRPPLIIIFEDFESFTPKVLQDFIRNLSLLSHNAFGYNTEKGHLQFVLVFGIATTVNAIHQTLPHTVTSQLAIEKFASQPSIRLLANVIEKIIVKNSAIAFKIGGHALNSLNTTFVLHDFSVKRFLMAYKYCLLEHFSQNGASSLCCETLDEVEVAVANLTHDDLEEFRHLTSYKEALANGKVMSALRNLEKIKMENDENKKESNEKIDEKTLKKQLETDNSFFKTFVLQNVLKVREATETFNAFVDVLYKMSLDLPGQFLGKYYHSVYIQAMTNQLLNSDTYRRAFCYFHLYEKSGMIKQLDTFLACLNPFLENIEAKAVYMTAQKYKIELENLDGLVSPLKDEKIPDAIKPIVTPPVMNITPKSKLDRSKWKEALLVQAKDKEKKRHNLNPYEALRKRIVDFYSATFTRIFSADCAAGSISYHPLSQIFYEVFYFKENTAKGNGKSTAAFIHKRLHGLPRDEVQKALNSPSEFLSYIEEGDNNGKICNSESLPDICVAYKLYLENGRYINLFDWLRCWIAIVTNGAEEHAPDASGKMVVNPRLQARFSRCVSELQFLGFIRPSKRKTDHVEKLTWN